MITHAAAAAAAAAGSGSGEGGGGAGGRGGGGEGGAEGGLTVWAGCLDGSVRRWDVNGGTWTQRGAE